MGSSGNSSSGELPGRVAAVLAPKIFPGAHLALGLSGGLDSVALLSILLELAPALRFSLRAVHVNHGISPNAARWAEFCGGLCARLGVPLQLETVDISPHRHLGLEGAARRSRHEAFARVDADFVVLAQHSDDQAETLLLRLMRGAGLRGLAAMSPLRSISGTRARLLRPLLAVSRAEIETHARLRGLEWVEDESNADTVRRRNFLRRDIFPLLERQFPGARATIARAAAHLAEARELLDEMARTDFERCAGAEGVNVADLQGLGEARAKNLLRYWCETKNIEPLSAARTGELLRQLRESRSDARIGLAVPGWTFLRYRERLYLRRASPALERSLREVWDGANALPMLSLGGVLRFKPEEGRGLSLAKLRAGCVTARLRQGGERLRLDAGRPRRTLKNLFQERGVPPWRRDRLPLIYCGDELVSVPGIGDAFEFRAVPGEAGLIVTWEPFE
ncbi:MAG: tRNA lysidine(34) synthetase TilS [Betaproteobacteria bacterium]|nr:MAG: tRNA lysidine(34) synthetase TilS [Betaproteobacteria bacterium]